MKISLHSLKQSIDPCLQRSVQRLTELQEKVQIFFYTHKSLYISIPMVGGAFFGWGGAAMAFASVSLATTGSDGVLLKAVVANDAAKVKRLLQTLDIDLDKGSAFKILTKLFTEARRYKNQEILEAILQKMKNSGPVLQLEIEYLLHSDCSPSAIEDELPTFQSLLNVFPNEAFKYYHRAVQLMRLVEEGRLEHLKVFFTALQANKKRLAPKDLDDLIDAAKTWKQTAILEYLENLQKPPVNLT